MSTLTVLRALLVWITILASAAPLSRSSAQTSPSSPCPGTPEYRQFDFWVGEWDVTDRGKTIATSSIQRIIGDCIIFENYTQGQVFSGKSFNFFDATLRKWRQTWVDSNGNVSEFVGEFRDNAMHLEGESHRQNGKKILRRMIVSSLGPDRVRQYSERSLDGGMTWGIAYDYIYIRRR